MKVVKASETQDGVINKVLDQYECVIHGGPGWICTLGNRQAIIPRAEMARRPWYRRVFNCAPRVAGIVIVERCKSEVREIHVYDSKYLSLCKSVATFLEKLGEHEIVVRAFLVGQCKGTRSET